jgi:endonuclease/exonuclease/phosphatase family metal-dependent hydrolase
MPSPTPQHARLTPRSRYLAPRHGRTARRVPVWRLLVLVAALLVTALVAVDNAPLLAKVGERVWWTVAPARSVTHVAEDFGYETLELNWRGYDTARDYTVVLATDRKFQNVVEERTTTATKLAVNDLVNATRYFYRIEWTTAFGNDGPRTKARSFDTLVRIVDKPRELSVSPDTSTSFVLTWAPVQWATEYVVRMSRQRDPARFGESPEDVEYPATSATTFRIDGIPSTLHGERYFFTVRAANRELSEARSRVVVGNVKPDAPGKAHIAGESPASVTVAWKPVPNVENYVVERSSSPDFATIDAAYSVPPAYDRMSVNGLGTGTTYYFRVRGMNGIQPGFDTQVLEGTTLAAGALGLRVATFNVLDNWVDDLVAPWSVRRANVARTIDYADADIVGLQEANSTGRLSNGRTQVQDILSLTTGNLRIAPSGLRGKQILYKTGKFEPHAHGVFSVPQLPNDVPRAAIWQVFQHRKTGTRFIVVNAHLSNGKTSTENAARVAQAKSILRQLDRVNTRGLPVVLVGDLNSFDTRAETTPMSTFAADGYVDAELSSAESLTPGLNTWVAAKSPLGKIRLDHVAVSTDIAVDRTAVVDIDFKNDQPASDHRMLYADISLASRR